MGKLDVQAIFDQDSHTFSYLVSDPRSKAAAVIDSVRGYKLETGRTDYASADRIIALVKANSLNVIWHLETHIHADHLSAAPYLKQELGGEIAISYHVDAVLNTFSDMFNLELEVGNSAFDVLLDHGKKLNVGTLEIEVLHTPGHTPACSSFLIGDAVFVGDTLFMPDYGTARCDFPGGDAKRLYQSIRLLLALPPETRMFLCHDYLPTGRNSYQYETTVAEQNTANVHIHAAVSEAEFIAQREARDAVLNAPKLILPAIQVNMNGGNFPKPEANGISYLKVPIDQL